MSNDGICSFRVANRLSALTSRSTAYVATIRQNQRDEKVDVPLSRYTAHDRHIGVEMSDNFMGLPPASRLSSNSSHLCDSLRYQTNPSSPPPRNAWLHDKVSLKRATSANSVTERMLRVNADCDQSAARKNFLNKGKFSCVPVGHTPLHLRSLGRDTNGILHGRCRRTIERLVSVSAGLW